MAAGSSSYFDLIVLGAGTGGYTAAFRGAQLIVTYHPAYLLRDPRQKKEAWADLQIAMRELGLKPPAKV